MTPTERAAVAEAIAALEESKNWIARCDDATDAILPDKSDVVEQLTASLASLRAVAPVTGHDWIKSTLGHGETMCRKCAITNREAAVLRCLDVCEGDAK